MDHWSYPAGFFLCSCHCDIFLIHLSIELNTAYLKLLEACLQSFSSFVGQTLSSCVQQFLGCWEHRREVTARKFNPASCLWQPSLPSHLSPFDGQMCLRTLWWPYEELCRGKPVMFFPLQRKRGKPALRPLAAGWHVNPGLPSSGPLRQSMIQVWFTHTPLTGSFQCRRQLCVAGCCPTLIHTLLSSSTRPLQVSPHADQVGSHDVSKWCALWSSGYLVLF